MALPSGMRAASLCLCSLCDSLRVSLRVRQCLRLWQLLPSCLLQLWWLLGRLLQLLLPLISRRPCCLLARLVLGSLCRRLLCSRCAPWH